MRSVSFFENPLQHSFRLFSSCIAVMRDMKQNFFFNFFQATLTMVTHSVKQCVIFFLSFFEVNKKYCLILVSSEN